MLQCPRRRQRLEKIIKLKRAGLASSEDSLNDVWRDQGQAEDTAEIGNVDLLGLREFCRGGILPAFKHLPPAVGADHGFQEGCIAARGGRP
jgi:hypothetical protein